MTQKVNPQSLQFSNFDNSTYQKSAKAAENKACDGNAILKFYMRYNAMLRH